MTPSAFQRATLAVVILVAGAWYWYVRSHAPAVASVNGVYTNACCSDLVLQDGVIIAGKVQVSFKLENMKFGLTAYPSKQLEVHGTQVVVRTTAEEDGVLFDKGGTALTLCGDLRCDREYVFTRH